MANYEGLNPDLYQAYRNAQTELGQQGINLSVVSGTRTIEQQAGLRAAKGRMAAKAGPYAPHVAGNALDLAASGGGVAGIGDARVASVLKKHGLINPVPGEAWHWEPSLGTALGGGTPTQGDDTEALADFLTGSQKPGPTVPTDNTEALADFLTAPPQPTRVSHPAHPVPAAPVVGGTVGPLARPAPPVHSQLGSMLQAESAALREQVKAIHSGMLYPEEVKAREPGPVGQFLSRIGSPIAHFLTGGFAEASKGHGLGEGTNQRRYAMMQSGAYPALPELPAVLTAAGRKQYIDEKNRLIEMMQEMRRGQVSVGALGISPQRQEKELVKSLTPWQRTLYPVLKQQMAAEEQAALPANKALAADVAGNVVAAAVGGPVGKVAGRVMGRALGPIAAESVGRALGREGFRRAATVAAARGGAALVSGAAAGAAGGGAASGLTSLAMGATPQQALTAAGHGVKSGALFGAGFGLLHSAVGSSLETFQRNWDPETGPQHAQNVASWLGKKFGLAPEQVQDLAGQFEELGKAPALKKKAAAARIQETLKFYRARPAQASPMGPEGPAAPVAPEEAITPIPRRGPVLETAGGPVAVRSQPVEAIQQHVMAATAAGDAAGAAHGQQWLGQHQQYQERRQGAIAPEEAGDYLRAWNSPKEPARQQFDVLNAAAERYKAESPALAQGLTQAAETARDDFRFRFVDQRRPSEAPPVEPPQQSVWRSLPPVTQAELPTPVRQALLLQDISNSQQVLNPVTPTLHRASEVLGKPRSLTALAKTADDLFGQAETHLAAKYPAPPVEVAAPAEPAAPSPEVAPAPPETYAGPERRIEEVLRKQVEVMTSEEKDLALHAYRQERTTDELTGLGNARAWNEVEKKPHIAAIDADGLGYVNDHYGHEAGDALIASMGDTLRQAGLGEDAYHKSGDEYFAHHLDRAELEKRLELARMIQEHSVVSYVDEHGQTRSLKGLSISYGIDATKEAADARLLESKARRTEVGLRAPKTQRPPGLAEVGAAGKPGGPVAGRGIAGGAVQKGNEAHGAAAERQPGGAVEAKPGAARKRAVIRRSKPTGEANAERVDKSQPKGRIVGMRLKSGVPLTMGEDLPGRLREAAKLEAFVEKHSVAYQGWIKGLADKVLTPEQAGRLKLAGVLLHAEEGAIIKGVHFGDQMDQQAEHTVFINPFASEELVPGRTYRSMTSGGNEPKELARSTAWTILHELAHVNVKDEGLALWQEMDRMLSLPGATKELGRISKEIEYAISEGGVLTPEFRAARAEFIRAARATGSAGAVERRAVGPRIQPAAGDEPAGLSGRKGGASADKEAGPGDEERRRLKALPPGAGGEALHPVPVEPEPDYGQVSREGSSWGEIDDPELRRLVEENSAVPGPSLPERLKEGLARIKNATSRPYERLPRTAEWAQINDGLRKLSHAREIAGAEAIFNLQAALQELSKQEYKTFSDVLLFQGMAEDITDQREKFLKAGGDPAEWEPLIPEGFTVDGVARQNALFLQELSGKEHPGETPQQKLSRERINRALFKLQEVRQIKDEYLDSFEKVLGRRPAMDKTVYFRHKIIAYRLGKILAGGKGLNAPSDPSFLKQRRGSLLAYDMDLITAEMDWLPDMIRDKMVLDFLGLVQDTKDIYPQLKAQMQADPTKKLKDLIPTDYKVWRGAPGSIFKNAYSVPEQIATEIELHMGEAFDIPKALMGEVLQDTERGRILVIPRVLADTLDIIGVAEPDSFEHWALKGLRYATGAWKYQTLFNLFHSVPYFIRNGASDLQAMARGNPNAVKYVRRAAGELSATMLLQKPPAAELREWMKRGGLPSLLNAAEEIGAFQGVDLLGRFAVRGTPPLKKLWNGMVTLASLPHDIREATGRYAAYLSYLDQIKEHGRPVKFGASLSAEVQALPDVRDKAFKLANDLIGAYDEVSEAGRFIRRYVSPFWSWQEVNPKREKRFAQNAWENPQLMLAAGEKIGGQGIGQMRAMAMGKWALGAFGFGLMLTAFNRLLFGKEEQDLPRDVRGRPHLIVGRDPETGEPIYYTQMDNFSDALGWFNLDNYMGYREDYLNGRLSLPEILFEMGAKAPAERLISSLGPQYKAVGELATGTRMFPHPFNPQKVRDRWEQFFDQFHLAPVYREVQGLPDRPGTFKIGPLELPFGAVTGAQRANLGRNASLEISQMARLWLQKQGITPGEGGGSAKSVALYYHKQAMQYGDKESAARFLVDYILAAARTTTNPDAIAKGYAASLKALDPLSSLKETQQKKFLGTLSEADGQRLRRAYAYYGGLVAPEVNLQSAASLTLVQFVRAAQRRIEGSIDRKNPVARTIRQTPGLRQEVRQLERANR